MPNLSEYTIVYIAVKRDIDFSFKMPHEIVSAERQFKFQNVYDISHKPFSFGGGMLYLHTNQGVFSYNIKDNPAYFIEAFKTLKSSFK